MQIKSRILTGISVIFITSAGIACFWILNFFGFNESNNSVPLPKTTDWIIRADAVSFVKKELYTVLFESKDDQLLVSLQELFDKTRKIKGNRGPLYINYNSNIVLYGTHVGDATFSAVLFQLERPSIFQKNISSYLKSNQKADVNGSTALILTQTGGKKIDSKQFKSIVHQYVNSQLTNLNDVKQTENELMTIMINKTSEKIGVQNLKFGISPSKSSIDFKGSLSYTKAQINEFNYDVKVSGCHIFSKIVPAGLTDTLNKLIPLGDFKFSEIQGIALDYNGISLEETKEGLPSFAGYLPVPSINLVVSCKKPVSIEQIWNLCPKSIQEPNFTLNFGTIRYVLKQLDAHTIFVGIDPNSVLSKENAALVQMNGNLSKLTLVRGSSFVSAIVQNMGPIKTGNDFFSSSSGIDFKMTQLTDGNFQLKGKIDFKEGKFPLNEVTKLLIGLKVIR